MTISVPHLWNWSQRSFCSRVTLGSSWTLSSSGRGILGGIPPKGKPGNLGNIPMPFGSPAGVLKLFVGPNGEKPGCCGGWAAPGCPWIMPGGNPKSGRGAKFGMNGVEKAMFALHGDILLRTYTSKFTFLVVQVHCVCAVNVHKSYVLLVVFLHTDTTPDTYVYWRCTGRANVHRLGARTHSSCRWQTWCSTASSRHSNLHYSHFCPTRPSVPISPGSDRRPTHHQKLVLPARPAPVTLV